MSFTSVSLPSPLLLHSSLFTVPLPPHSHSPHSPLMFVVAPVIVNLTASPFTGVSQGIPLNLTCEAVGGPTLNVAWATPTGPMVGSVISIDSVTADDAGEYRCEVTTETETTNESITIRGKGGSLAHLRILSVTAPYSSPLTAYNMWKKKVNAQRLYVHINIYTCKCIIFANWNVCICIDLYSRIRICTHT